MTKSVNNTSFLKDFAVCTTVRLFSVTEAQYHPMNMQRPFAEPPCYV